MIHLHSWTICWNKKTTRYYCMKCKEVKTFTRDNNFQKSVGKVEFLSDLNDEQLEDLKQPFWTKFFNQFK